MPLCIHARCANADRALAACGGARICGRRGRFQVSMLHHFILWLVIAFLTFCRGRGRAGLGALCWRFRYEEEDNCTAKGIKELQNISRIQLNSKTTV